MGRSGTAITAELATNTVLGEVRALQGMGIDPYHYLVLPRLFGCVVSVCSLMVLFDVVSVLGGFLAAAFITGIERGQVSGGSYSPILRPWMSCSRCSRDCCSAW